MAEKLGSISEEQAMNEVNPPFIHGSAMSSNISIREHALKYDLGAGRVLSGNEFPGQQKEAAALSRARAVANGDHYRRSRDLCNSP